MGDMEYTKRMDDSWRGDPEASYNPSSAQSAIESGDPDAKYDASSGQAAIESCYGNDHCAEAGG